MMTDPIADMLTRLRNAAMAGHKWADMPVSKQKIEIARILGENSFVHAHKVLDDGLHGVLRVYLKYYEGQPVIR
ncbi:MAG: 30S ribosomal protein S8, partial [Proteobacteria bacterium]|nr:30S ribosomal protein S8 [Pseudomonadota bacterium]